MPQANYEKPVVYEKNIQSDCTQWLALDGWRPLRTDPVRDRRRATGFGEPGMADHLYIRYGAHGRGCKCFGKAGCVGAQIVWIEWKRPKSEAKQHQLDWHAKERALGAVVLLAGIDFPPTVEGFKEYYRNSSLRRNVR